MEPNNINEVEVSKNYKEEKKKTIVLLVVGLLTLTVTIIGATFAFFSIGVGGNDTASSVIIKSATLGISYDSGRAIIVNDFRPGDSESKTFTVTNTGDGYVDYNIRWVDVTNDFATKADLKYEAIGTVTAGNGTAGSITAAIAPDVDTNMISNIRLNAGSTHSYAFRIYFENYPTVDQNENQGKTFMGKIEVQLAP